MQCRDEQGKWEPVAGGGLKFGETVEAAARREIAEECGATALDLEYIGYRDVFRTIDGKPTHWIAFDMRAKIDPAQARITEPHKCDEQRWVTIDELVAMDDLHSQYPHFLNKYKDVLI